ncbi:hypothetical protein HanXRQr2_Chr09g0380891 [Helianthus annuus]|uniref:Uncharacterized protein n=1 Tax=Helianthus annuus TaxID=4232 RepID=A0A9K3I5A2_HELAN|nr:hypothetical protein HanXRQr2_Chr09g0380891 [Helianthus annuus]
MMFYFKISYILSEIINKPGVCVFIFIKVVKENRGREVAHTLHIGATKTPPSQYSGFFLCNKRTIAPPIDSPSNILIFLLFSFFSENKMHIN